MVETWLTDSHYDSELFDDRYMLFRKDRNTQLRGKCRGGGVILAVQRKYNAFQMNNIAYDLDCVLVKFVSKILSLYMCVVYFEPNSPLESYEQFFMYLESSCPPGSIVCLMGDFNLPEITSTNINITNASVKCQELINFMTFFELESHNHIMNKNGRTLDLILTNVTNVKVEHETSPLVKPDPHHPALLITITFTKPSKTKLNSNIRSYNFQRANFELLYKELATIDWGCLESCNTVNIALTKFYQILYDILDKCVPVKKVATNSYPCWFTKNIISNIKRKYYHYKKWRKAIGNTDYHYSKFVQLRKRVKQEISLAYQKFLTDTENTILYDPSNFWEFIKKRTRHLPPTSMTNNGQIIYNNDEIANCFASYFQSVYQTESAKYEVRHLDSKSDLLDSFVLSNITLSEIENAIKKLKPKKSIGPDHIPPYVVKGCGEILKLPLLFIFNLSFKTSTFPDKWKEAIVCPIPKSNSKSEISNYRPISILSSFAKVFESIIYNRIINHVQSAISPFQHGFLAKRSTYSNLAVITDHIASALDKGSQIDVIYTDLAKAFDTVNHDILLHKLSYFNFTGTSLTFLASYLENRKQSVLYKEYISRQFEVRSGVPQGSNLGPLLFLIFINDLPNCIVNSNKLLFADDLKLYMEISSLEDCTKLQCDLNNVTKWCKENSLVLNINKCKTVSFTKRKNKYNYKYTIQGIQLNSSDSVKDLGVTFDPNLTFNTHIVAMKNEAYRNLGLIMRLGKDFNNLHVLKLLYFCYVRSKLEYASVIWNPQCNKYSRTIEVIQSKFLRFLVFKQTGFYPKFDSSLQLAENFDLLTLEQRRIINDILFLSNIINHKIDCIDLNRAITIKVPQLKTRIRKNDFFFCHKARTNTMLKSPIWRTCATYNKYLEIDNEMDIYNMSKATTRSKILQCMSMN